MAISLVPAAQYLRMSTEHQYYSLDFQRTVIQSYAERHDFQIVTTYVDAGKSGLVLKHREGLARLLHDVVAGVYPFRAILVYDVSRWGRFQDSDEAAHYEFLCKHAGIPVHYCAETFSNDGTMANTIMKSLKRVMAAEYSRELSEKMFHCMRRMIAKGYWVGGPPGYAFRRMFISADGTRQHLMQSGQQKEFRNGHVVIVPGPPEEVACVREIFRMYIEERMSTLRIAAALNERGIPREGIPWNYRAIVKVLFDEKYAGTMVWNRFTERLSGRYVRVPREKWIVQPGAIPPIVDRKTFERAQEIRAQHPLNASNEELLEKLRTLFALHGRMNSGLINKARTLPSATCYMARFGSIRKVYELLDYRRTDTVALRQQTAIKVKKLHIEIFGRLRKLYRADITAVRYRNVSRPRRLRFSSGLEVYLVVCLFEKMLDGSTRWRFQGRAAQRSGFITLLCRCNETNTAFHDFLVVPSVSHIAVVSLLKEDDERLRLAQKIQRLSSFRKVAHAMASQRGSISAR